MFQLCFKKDNNNFRLVQKLTTGQADFKHSMRLQNQLVVEENFRRESNLPPVLLPTIFREMDVQLQTVDKVVEVVDRANRKICDTLLRYNVSMPESSYAQVRLSAR